MLGFERETIIPDRIVIMIIVKGIIKRHYSLVTIWFYVGKCRKKMTGIMEFSMGNDDHNSGLCVLKFECFRKISR